MKDKYSKTPLKYAIERNSVECVQLLLEYIMETEDIYEKMDEIEI
jgi:hypothetical protein